ncbi:alpha/beta hydrolase [Candidatus Pacearchaeota archaeon]|nr:alpha/beta hydrolase [Candidatus Pacearchaeota archaeon]
MSKEVKFKKMEEIIMIAFKIFLALIGIVLFVSILQFGVNIHPPRYYDSDTPSNYGLEYENVSFVTSDKIKIRGWLITSKSANGTVIIGHGYPFNKGNILPVAKFLYPDYNLLFYDHRYFGESEGKITTAGLREVEDVKATISFVQERFGKEEPISLYGFSLSAPAILMAKPEVKAIIAESAYANLERVVEHIFERFGIFKFPFVKVTNMLSLIIFGVHPKEVSPALSIKEIDIPVLIIHGEKDTQIPAENAYILKKNNPKAELWIAKNADHGQVYALYKDEYESRIKNFLEEHMQKTK